MFKAFKGQLLEHSTINLLQLNHDVINLAITHRFGVPLNRIYNHSHISQIYSTFDIIHHNNFIYKTSANMDNLNTIIQSNPVVEQRLAQVVLQDAIGSHAEILTDFIYAYLKLTIKLASPLVAALIAKKLISGYETVLATPVMVLA